MPITINGDTGFSGVDGTASVPALVGTDTDTGVYFSAANTLDFATGGTRRASINSTGDLQFNSGYGSVATAYGCRAWVNFNGSGTVAIRSSGNVTSITDNGTGDYTINFTNTLTDANYSAVGTGVQLANLGSGSLVFISATTSAYRFSNRDANNNLADGDNIFVAIFR